jgi:hypothetical protein
VELLEHWWDGSWGTRQDVFLRRNPAGLWEVEWRQYGRPTYREFATETAARELVRSLTTAPSWRKLDSLPALPAH